MNRGLWGWLEHNGEMHYMDSDHEGFAEEIIYERFISQDDKEAFISLMDEVIDMNNNETGYFGFFFAKARMDFD